MKITLIYPSVKKKKGNRYIKSWQMEPLAIGILYALTPKAVNVRFYDDRVEDILFDEPTDMVAISVETYSARRSYEIAAEYRKRNVRVVMGGFHATLMPDEVAQHADAVVIGNAEEVWQQILTDASSNQLKRIYQATENSIANFTTPDRGIFSGKPYLKLSLIEASRGCEFDCEFCAITSYYKRRFVRRPLGQVMSEIRQLKDNTIFFVDDNIIGDIPSALELFKAMAPEKISWVGQCSINVAQDDVLLDALAESGCIGLLIGFESIVTENLQKMHKSHNGNINDYRNALVKLRKRGIIVYGTFVLGYDEDDEKVMQQTVDFSIKEQMFIAAINHLVPFPNTPLYHRLKKEGRLRVENWWTDPNCQYGDIFYYPKKVTWERLTSLCLDARKQFYGLGSIFKRSLEFKANCKTLKMVGFFFFVNMLMKREVMEKRNVWSDK